MDISAQISNFEFRSDEQQFFKNYRLVFDVEAGRRGRTEFSGTWQRGRVGTVTFDLEPCKVEEEQLTTSMGATLAND